MSETKFTIGLFAFFDILFVMYYFIHPLENFGTLLLIGFIFQSGVVVSIYEHGRYLKEKEEKEKYKILYEARNNNAND